MAETEPKPKPLFALGQVVSTPGALAAFEQAEEDVLSYLTRHVTGEWGGAPHDGIDNCDLIAIC